MNPRCPRLVSSSLDKRLAAMPAAVTTGARQTGKSTLARSFVPDRRQTDWLVGGSVNPAGTLDARVAVVRFPEESNRTLSFADFLIGMCGILKEVFEDEPLWTELFAAVETEEDDAKVADTLVPAIREENRRRGRTLLVMLENLGEILGRQIRDRNDIAALRKFLMADNGCLLVATAPLHFDGITDIEQPFYDFFDQDQFHLLLDRISPFYQGRLDDLPPGQRALLECLASMRDQEKTPAAIAARMRMSQQETSSLLKRLTDAHYLRAARHPRDRRSRLYTIREGFFDIWLAMNLSNLAHVLKDTNRVEEAEPLMRRSLDILASFSRQTGHEHPYLQRAIQNYQALWAPGARCSPESCIG